MEWLLISWPMLILLGFGLRMALRLTYGARGPEPDDPIHVLLNITSWVLVGLGIAPAVLGGILTFVGTIILLLVAVTFIEAVVQRRLAQRRTIGTLLSLLCERGVPVETSLLFSGQSMGGIVGRAAQKLSTAMQGGLPLDAAVKRYPAALPPRASAYLAGSTTTAGQAAALRELSRSEQSETAVLWRSIVDRLVYLTAVVLIMVSVLTFVMIRIVPEFELIFHEFGAYPPLMTQAAIAAATFFSAYLVLPATLLALAAFITAILVGALYLCDVSVLRWLDGWLASRNKSADILRILSLAAEQRQPVADVVRRLSEVYPSPALRRKLRSASKQIDSGVEWRDALCKARIFTEGERSLFKTAERVGNLPWALRIAAARREKQSTFRLASVLQVLYPLTILLLGTIIGFYVIALFVPLVTLIEGLA